MSAVNYRYNLLYLGSHAAVPVIKCTGSQCIASNGLFAVFDSSIIQESTLHQVRIR